MGTEEAVSSLQYTQGVTEKLYTIYTIACFRKISANYSWNPYKFLKNIAK